MFRLKFPPREPREVITLPLTEPLHIRLAEDVGKLPSGFVYEIPRFEAERLILHRKAAAVGSLAAIPDVVLDEDDLAQALEGACN